MCGIFGTVDIECDDRILDLMKHRGPDGSGFVTRVVGGHRVALGHRRLAIVDLSETGAQPMHARERHWLVYNGEIYNHDVLRRRMPEVSFRGHSDTETLLAALAARGLHAVNDLNGIFAFAWLDEEHARLYLVRDPFGVKPLYYVNQNGTLAFASELRLLRPLFADTLDTGNLAELLRLRYSPSPDTLYRHTKKLRAGHVLEVALDGPSISVREYPWFDMPVTRCTLPFEEAVTEYGALLEQAVKRQLMADVDVGVLLSAGVDSALVARFAQQHSGARIKAFTVGFDGDNAADETRGAAETARVLGLEHHSVRIGFDGFMDTLRQAVLTVEEPLATTSIVPMEHLAALAAGHVKVVLSGQGADEPLGGYGRYQGEVLRRRVPRALFGVGSRIAQWAGVKDEQTLRGLRALGNADDAGRFLAAYTVFDADEIQRLIGQRDDLSLSRVTYAYDALHCAEREAGAARLMALDTQLNLADDLLLYTDKITMRHSLECRVPLLDIELVRFALSLPADYRVRWRKGKIIHKAFAQRVLPPEIVHRKKQGFESPTKRWFVEHGARLKDMLLAPGTPFARVFDATAVESVLRKHAEGFNRERHLFLLLGIFYWFEANS